MKMTMKLPVTLQDHEVLERGEALARALGEVKAAEEDARAAAKIVKETVEAAKAEVDALRRVVAARSEERMVDVEVNPVPTKRLMVTHRLDTMEVVATRPMTHAELSEHVQVTMFDDDRHEA